MTTTMKVKYNDIKGSLEHYDLNSIATSKLYLPYQLLYMPYLDIKTRGRLVGMHQAGLPFRVISDLAGIPLTTVYDTIDKYQQIGTVRTQKERERQELSHGR
ncbi:hypothetical protein O181_118804 [Austropuccinia psidii MF-1]|uniref:Uncharacterized protein n=1 Tax=Austropuccinia psidii MF-1 TaxID=1389203 RepID=A0A9Q3KDF3_9BASI|nr:hypothetical protein [Austropuccinia psidii MF-1]